MSASLALTSRAQSSSVFYIIGDISHRLRLQASHTGPTHRNAVGQGGGEEVVWRKSLLILYLPERGCCDLVSTQKRNRKRLFSSHTLGTSCSNTIISTASIVTLVSLLYYHSSALTSHARHRRTHTQYLAKRNGLRNLEEQQVAVSQIL